VFPAIYFSASCGVYIDSAMLVVGSQPANYVPLHPADDLARCLRYYELIGETTGEFLLGGYGVASGQMQWFIPYKVRKAVTPTVTKNGTWAVSNTGQPTLPGYGVTGFAIQAIPTASGPTFVSNNAAGCYVSIEANP
jgi:hypothetical protein